MERWFLLTNSWQWTESLHSESQGRGDICEVGRALPWVSFLVCPAGKGLCRLCQMLNVQPSSQNLPVLVSAHTPQLIFYLLKGDASTFSHLTFHRQIIASGTQLAFPARLCILKAKIHSQLYLIPSY